MDHTIKEGLKKAAQLLKDTDLAKGYYARDARGWQVEYDDPSAVSYCMFGAIHKFIRDWDKQMEADLKCQDTIRLMYGKDAAFNCSQWNDREETTKEQVIEVLNRAYAIA